MEFDTIPISKICIITRVWSHTHIQNATMSHHQNLLLPGNHLYLHIKSKEFQSKSDVNMAGTSGVYPNLFSAKKVLHQDSLFRELTAAAWQADPAPILQANGTHLASAVSMKPGLQLAHWFLRLRAFCGRHVLHEDPPGVQKTSRRCPLTVSRDNPPRSTQNIEELEEIEEPLETLRVLRPSKTNNKNHPTPSNSVILKDY